MHEPIDYAFPRIFQGYEALEETFKTVYIFTLAVVTVDKEWVVRKRFSHFEKVWLQVEAEVMEADPNGKVLFPSKNLTSFGFLDTEGLDQRVRDLQLFMSALLNVPMRASVRTQIMIFLSEGAAKMKNLDTNGSDAKSPATEGVDVYVFESLVHCDHDSPSRNHGCQSRTQTAEHSSSAAVTV